MGWKDFIKIVKTVVTPETTVIEKVVPFITNPQIKVDPRLLRRVKNDPSLLHNSDFVEETLNRYPGLTLEALRRIIESQP